MLFCIVSPIWFIFGNAVEKNCIYWRWWIVSTVESFQWSWIVKSLLVRGDGISWVTGLLQYNAGQFITLLNVRSDVKETHEIRKHWSPTNKDNSTVPLFRSTNNIRLCFLNTFNYIKCNWTQSIDFSNLEMHDITCT